MKTPKEQFNDLYNAVARHSVDIKEQWDGYVTGTMLGYTWRLFQETDHAWIGICDETSIASLVPAFYDPADVEQWIKNKKDEE